MSQRKRLVLISSLPGFGAAICGVAYFVWLINSQSIARAQWEHGITLPASVGYIECRGDANRLFLDRGASTVFDIDSADLPAFKSSLPPRVTFDTFVPGNTQYRDFSFPWTAAHPVETLSCQSPTGDWLHVEVSPMQGSRVGLWMYTDWN